MNHDKCCISRWSARLLLYACLVSALPGMAQQLSGYPISHSSDAKNMSSRISLVTKDEPGERILISGVLYEKDSTTPIKGAVLFLYHTDHRGIYTEEDCFEKCPRLRGYVKADNNGRYEILTIKPGWYPHMDGAAHIHVGVVQANGEIQHLPRWIFFEGDLRLSKERLARSATMKTGYGLVRLIRDENGVPRGVRNFIIEKSPDPPQDHSPEPPQELKQQLRSIILASTDAHLRGNWQKFNSYCHHDFIFSSEYESTAGLFLMNATETRELAISDERYALDDSVILMSFVLQHRITRNELKFTNRFRNTVTFAKTDTAWKMIALHRSPLAFERNSIKLPNAVLNSYSGVYQHPFWGSFTVVPVSDGLAFTSSAGYTTHYLPESETEFFLKEEEERKIHLQTISFVRNSRGKTIHCIFRYNDGQNIIARKIR